MKKIAILFLSLCLSGCVVAFQNLYDPGFEKVRIGMSKEETIETIGRPLSQKVVTIKGKDYEAWEYPVQEPAKRRFSQVGTSYYQILFLDGKVERWEKIKVYAQPSYGFEEPSAPEGNVTAFKFYKNK